ncbi:MAG: nitroreductase [Anaerolineae bacterium]|jgi:nitroreductase|nr:nitroreductase [Anaerolineae bacterium]MBT7073354.1 nitroreductase [Anaerolineae bacterium]MBT7782356.1 nitroreductase [Anaerolineae bacterium]
MNTTLDILLNRKSVRAFEKRPIEADVRTKILEATLRAPTAGNMMLYSILDINDQSIKEKLVKTCDDQPFIARAPMVWIFLADFQRWYDYFIHSGVDEVCAEREIEMRKPEEGDLFLACSDTLIAAQNAVVAAESFGIGSCYIGDIMENYETHKEMFDLPPHVFPIAMLVFGYPTQQQKDRKMTSRFDEKFIVFENKYQRLDRDDFEEMFAEREKSLPQGKAMRGITNFGQNFYNRKFASDFSMEMSRSVREMVKAWIRGD